MNRKMILSIILVALLAFLAFGFFQASKLTNIHITKAVTIQGDQQEVFDMVKYLENFPKWSPFLEADPSQSYEVKGTDGQVGAQFHWEGNGGKDLGYQEIVNIKDLSYIGMQCHIAKPFQATPTFEYSFSNSADGVTVTQDFKVQSGIVDAFFMWLFGAKKEMAATNERGLFLLKSHIEQSPTGSTAYKVTLPH